MTEAISAANPSSSTPPEAYHASGGRRVTFSFIFLLLLPFFVSLGPMLYQRVSRGLWYDTIGLLVLAVAFTLVMVLILMELFVSLRMRVELGDKTVKLALPAARGPTPLFSYKKYEIPYSDIAAVETRREIYGGSVAPVFMKGARIVKKDGESIRLGYVSEANIDPAFPFPEIAEKIAQRAGVPVTDRGSVKRWVHKKMLGLKADDTSAPSIDETVIATLNRRHDRIIWGVVAALVALVGVGITLDFIALKNAPPSILRPAP